MGWLTYEQPAVVFSEGTIVRKPQYRGFPRRRVGNRSRIAETVIHSVTTTPQP